MTPTKPHLHFHRLFGGTILALARQRGRTYYGKGATIGEAARAALARLPPIEDPVAMDPGEDKEPVTGLP